MQFALRKDRMATKARQAGFDKQWSAPDYLHPSAQLNSLVRKSRQHGGGIGNPTPPQLLAGNGAKPQAKISNLGGLGGAGLGAVALGAGAGAGAHYAGSLKQGNVMLTHTQKRQLNIKIASAVLNLHAINAELAEYDLYQLQKSAAVGAHHQQRVKYAALIRQRELEKQAFAALARLAGQGLLGLGKDTDNDLHSQQ